MNKDLRKYAIRLFLIQAFAAVGTVVYMTFVFTISEDNDLLHWILISAVTVFYLGILWSNGAGRAREDVKYQRAMENYSKQRNVELQKEDTDKFFLPDKGFQAALLSIVPFLVLTLLLPLLTNTSIFPYANLLVRALYAPYVMELQALATMVDSFVLICLLPLFNLPLVLLVGIGYRIGSRRLIDAEERAIRKHARRKAPGAVKNPTKKLKKGQ